ncbi:MAG TPA: HAMP domain-containing protein [Aggregatilineaceae bacterium]|nr:HAMP domain-containing protein [Aggregatilineaceae bacterium]
MKKLQDVSIQNKLIGVFAVVFLVGVLAIGWNIRTIDDAKSEINTAMTANKKEVVDTFASSRDEVGDAVATGQTEVFNVFDQSDELLHLFRIQREFYEMEAVEKDYVLAADPADPSGMVDIHHTVEGWLEDDIASGIELATDDTVAETLTTLQGELQAEAEFFDQLVSTMQDNPAAAQQMSLSRSVQRVDAVYNPLDQLINDQWDAQIESSDATRAQMGTTLGEVRNKLEQTLAKTDDSIKKTVDRANDQMDQAILISVFTVIVFLIAGVVAASVVLIISRQIVRPVLEMSDVAQAIENEQLSNADQLEPLGNRADEIGQLARVFRRMANEVFTRIERLKQQVAELKIVIDEKKLSQEVSEITNSDYFQDLQARANSLRRRDRRQSPTTPPEPPAGGTDKNDNTPT